MDVALVILDGWGLNPDTEARNAVATAQTPTVDELMARGACATLQTHGRHVGLPDGQMGNSEVGHLTIGAGRVITQESARITDAIERWRGGGETAQRTDDPPLDENAALSSAFEYARDNDGRVHVLGLVSDGGVHAMQAHLHALIELAADRGIPAVTHAITDGRDTSPTAGVEFVRELEAHANRYGTGHVATLMGRYYAMDRDENWDRTKRAYDAIVSRECAHHAVSGVAAVEAAYERDQTDEFIEPTCVADEPGLRDDDAVIFANFRADRARQLTRMLADIDPTWEFETAPPAVKLVTMTEYDEQFDLPVAIPPNHPEQVLGAVLATAGYRQLRIAETEKYAHVTYFLNGGREAVFEGETREIVPSPDVPTYDLAPEMSAPAVTDRAREYVRGGEHDVLVLNYANPDMVGHTGDFDAAVTAVEAVDTQLGRLLDVLSAADAHVIVAADHGNAEEMGTTADPHTAHTTNPVPVCYVTPDGSRSDRRLRDGELADLAPTVLDLLGVAVPAEMTGSSLFLPVE